MDEKNIFLSYCWADDKVANDICAAFHAQKEIKIHRDKIEIGSWRSIKEFMQSITQMDYVIMLISQKYLESDNCMYEVLEVMRNRNYASKIFPVIIYDAIYDPTVRLSYVKFWQDKTKQFKKKFDGIEIQNLHASPATLKHYHEISLHIDEFLGQIVDMNNPLVKDVPQKIKEILGIDKYKGQNESRQELYSGEDVFKKIGIEKNYLNSKPTDLEINQFISNAYNSIISLLVELCKQYERENSDVIIKCEEIDSRSNVIQVYCRGNLVRGLKIYRENMFGATESIFVSERTMSFGSGRSWNGQYDCKVDHDKLKLFALLSLGRGNEPMEPEDVVRDIWVHYIQVYLNR